MPNNRGLGRGFDSLIPTDIIETEFDVTKKPGAGSKSQPGEQVEEVAVEVVDPNPHQPRQHFDEAKLREMAESIKRHGIMQPLIASAAGSRYQLVAGERRLRAAKLAGLKTVPVIVRTSTDQQRMELALIENLQRADLNPMETATAYKKLQQEFGMTLEQIGRQVGRDSSTVANSVRLLGLPIEAKRAVAEGRVSEGTARVILSVEGVEKQLAVLDAILKNGFTTRQAEEFARGLKGETGSMEKAHQRAAITNELTNELSSVLGAKVIQQPRAKGGRLIIEYYSDEELDRIFHQIKGQ